MDEGAQKQQQQREVVTGGGEHGIDAVAVAAVEIIAVHPMLRLHVPDDRLDRGASFHFVADRPGHAAHLPGDPGAEFLFVVVAAIAFVHMDATGLDPSQRLQLGDDRSQGMTVEGVSMQCLGVQHKLAAFGLGGRGCHHTLQPNS